MSQRRPRSNHSSAPDPFTYASRDQPMGNVPAWPELTHPVLRRPAPAYLAVPISVPCSAQCIDLQGMHPLTVRRLGLVYRKYYTVTDFQVDPTPNHLGGWMRLLETGAEWLPCHFFLINAAVWPN